MCTCNLTQTAEGYHAAAAKLKRRITICAGTGCVANGSLKVFAAFERELAAAGLDVLLALKEENVATLTPESALLAKSGCQGFCQQGPLVTIDPDGILYCKVRVEDVPEIVQKTLVQKQLVDRLLYRMGGTTCRGQEEIPFYARQQRTVLKGCGMIDPDNIVEYIAHRGYEAARQAFTAMSAQDVCASILESGLRGRGGGGFPTGRKWELTRVQPGPKKYVICNGDEGDPGAFMDRSVMEGNPHAVIEGMMIAARAIGADEGYIYVRAEYPLAVKRLRRALADAEKAGLLGDQLFGTDMNFRLQVMEGAGAFVCGEETALIASVEGKRGMPSPKPPFPAQSGLWGKPTVINNVETLATVPLILLMGVAAFKAIGVPSSTGTKTFALTGHVLNTGLIEVPFGTTLGEVVLNIGGGVTNDKGELDPTGFKAVQIGGPSGGCLTPENLNLPLDFDSLRNVGAMVGSGGLVVMNHGTCMVSIARFFMQFTQNESCGKCVLCREGTKQMLVLLDDIMEGRGTARTLDVLEKTARAVQKGSLCGLGKTAPNPVLSTLRHFRKEYEEHVFNKNCPTKQCKSLCKPEIDPLLCKGCSACARKCPVNAISGEIKKPYVINADLCIKCGVCADVCKFNAVKGL